jgi:hypothetical protein
MEERREMGEGQKRCKKGAFSKIPIFTIKETEKG